MIEVRKTEAYSKWFVGLKDAKAKARILVRIERLIAGNFGDFKSIGESLYELRFDFGPGYRIYFLKHGGNLVILMAGGDKRTQADDIKKAQEMARILKETK